MLEIFAAAAYCLTVMALQFSVSTCIAQNAWTAWLRLSSDSLNRRPLRCLRRSSRSVSARILAFYARILATSRICDHTQPTCKRRVREAVHPQVAALRQAAALPCLDVHRPPFSARRILKTFRCHRRTSMNEETRFGTTMHSPKVVQDSGRLPSNHWTAARNRFAPCEAGESQFSRTFAASVVAVKQQRRRRAMDSSRVSTCRWSGRRSAWSTTRARCRCRRRW